MSRWEGRAVYRDGKLRPTAPLPFREGTIVHIIVETAPDEPALPEPPEAPDILTRMADADRRAAEEVDPPEWKQ